MTAVGCPLPAGHCHSERSEESRCLSLVISMPINTSRREDIRLSDDRHQKTVFSNARGTIPPPLAAYKTYRPLKGGKGKRLNGQARRLTSPHVEVLCRTSTGDYNPCLLQSEEMHPFWWLAPPPSPRRGDFILRYALALFCPRLRGKSGEAG